MPEPSYWTCPKLWPGETAFIVAGGPSVADLDLRALDGRRVIAVNSSVCAVMAAEFLYFGDARWWEANRDRIGGYAGTIVSTARSVISPRVKRMRKIKLPPGLALDPSSLVMQRTSLSGAINLAVHLGATQVVLLGADMQAAPDGRTHHHAPHRWPQRPGCWDEQLGELRFMVEPLRRLGVEVINCSAASRIDFWPKASFVSFLNEQREAA